MGSACRADRPTVSGHLTVTNNTVDDNGGFGFCKHPFDGYNLQLTVSGNVFSGNELGDSEW